MIETKIVPEYVDRSFGFDVYIKNAPLKKIWGDWALAINHNKLRDAVLIGLILQRGPLTGNQARCVRQVFNQHPSVFGESCGVSEATVQLWESRGDTPAGIDAAVEHRLRGLIFESLTPEAQQHLFKVLFGAMLEQMSAAQVVSNIGKALWSAVRAPSTQEHFHPTQELLFT